MRSRLVNQSLLGLLGLTVLTGWLGFAIGTPAGRLVAIAHGVSGLGILLLVPWKQTIARRGLRRSRPGTATSVALIAFTAFTIASGVAMAAFGLRALGPLTSMQVHVGAGMIALGLGIAHVVRRGAGGRPVDVGRRDFTRAALLTGGAVAAWAGLEGVMRLFRLPGADRRFTGSHERGSFDPAAMPTTQWIDDPVPDIDADDWRLTVTTDAATRSLRLDELGETTTRVAVLDCTTGWWSRQEWAGISLLDLLEPQDEQSFVVISHTGYRRRFPMRDADGMVLATSLGGQPLSAGHGFPARIVAPGRRGFWWVKWVVEIRADHRPWWWQGPFPVT